MPFLLCFLNRGSPVFSLPNTLTPLFLPFFQEQLLPLIPVAWVGVLVASSVSSP